VSLMIRIFLQSQYDQYKKCYDELTRVSKKFRVLKAHFDRASPGSAEQNEVCEICLTNI
jgi:hypothetical protein